VRRRDFIRFIAVSGATWPLAARAQEPGRIYRLGCLTAGSRDAPYFVAMVENLRRHGFVEGQNLTVDWHAFAQRVDLVPEFATEFVKARADIVMVSGDFAIRALQRATATIPILGVTEDMVGSGLVNSLARPNGNLTGVSILAAELDGKRQEILIDAVPGLQRMATLADTNSTWSSRFPALQDAARARNVELSLHRIAKPEDIVAAIDAAKESGAAALNVLASPVLYASRQVVMQRAAALHLPAMYQFAEVAEEGGFAAYGPRIITLYGETVARQIVKLMRGAKPADLPVEQPTKFYLVINLKTAKALGLDVPLHLLQLADEVIE
jgi:putative tryptophan/tyrosine transport system substrate-binding protein